MMEQKQQSRSRVKVAFFCVVGAHVAVILVALLAQGCKREQPVVTEVVETTTTEMDTNVFTDTSISGMTDPTVTTSAPPPVVEMPVVTPEPVAPAVTDYVIQKGDTFYSIAKKHGVSTKAVQDANPGVDPTKLKLGQKIVVPPATAATTAPILADTGEQVYVVKSGDTLSSISSRYHVTVKELRTANNLTTDKIFVKQKLKIPSNAVAPAPVPVPVVEPTPTLPPPPSGTTVLPAQ